MRIGFIRNSIFKLHCVNKYEACQRNSRCLGWFFCGFLSTFPPIIIPPIVCPLRHLLDGAECGLAGGLVGRLLGWFCSWFPAGLPAWLPCGLFGGLVTGLVSRLFSWLPRWLGSCFFIPAIRSPSIVVPACLICRLA